MRGNLLSIHKEEVLRAVDYLLLRDGVSTIMQTDSSSYLYFDRSAAFHKKTNETE